MEKDGKGALQKGKSLIFHRNNCIVYWRADSHYPTILPAKPDTRQRMARERRGESYSGVNKNNVVSM